MEGYVECRRCKGKGVVHEYGWDYDADYNKVRMDRSFRCPVCDGSGLEYNEVAYRLGIKPQYDPKKLMEMMDKAGKKKKKRTRWESLYRLRRWAIVHWIEKHDRAAVKYLVNKYRDQRW